MSVLHIDSSVIAALDHHKFNYEPITLSFPAGARVGPPGLPCRAQARAFDESLTRRSARPHDSSGDHAGSDAKPGVGTFCS